MQLMGSFGCSSVIRQEYPLRPRLKPTNRVPASLWITPLFCCLCRVDHAASALPSPLASRSPLLTPPCLSVQLLIILHTLPFYLPQRVSLESTFLPSAPAAQPQPPYHCSGFLISLLFLLSPVDPLNMSLAPPSKILSSKEFFYGPACPLAAFARV